MPLTPQQLNEDEWDGWKADDAVLERDRRFSALAERAAELKPLRILDIGCGSGTLAKFIRKRLPDAELHGVDFSANALKRCTCMAQTYCVDLDREPIPLEDASFNLIVCSEVLEHLFHPGHVMQEIFRLLNNEGTGIVTVPNFSFWRFRLQSLMGKVPKVIAHPGHLQAFNAAALSQMVDSFGLKTLSLYGIHQRFSAADHIWPGLTCDTLVCEFRKAASQKA